MLKIKYIMRDYAYQDNRSVAAMLQSNGDGREKLWRDYIKKHESEQSMEELLESFRKAARYGRIGPQQQLQLALSRILMALFVFFVVA